MVTVLIRNSYLDFLDNVKSSLAVPSGIRSEADRVVKQDCEVNAVAYEVAPPDLKKNAVKRQTVNCPNTENRRLVYDYTEPTKHRKIIRYKGSFEVFGFATIYTSENLLYIFPEETCTY